VILHFLNRDLQIIASALSPENKIKTQDGELCTEVSLGPVILNPGDYKISIGILSSNLSNPLVYYKSWWSAKIIGEKPDFGANYIRLLSKWNQKSR
jgi:hypothetical protein